MARQRIFEGKAHNAVQKANKQLYGGISEIKNGRFDMANREFGTIIVNVSFIYQTDKRFKRYQDSFLRQVYAAAFGMGLTSELMEKEKISVSQKNLEQLFFTKSLREHINLGKKFAAVGSEIYCLEILESGRYNNMDELKKILKNKVIS